MINCISCLSCTGDYDTDSVDQTNMIVRGRESGRTEVVHELNMESRGPQVAVR